MRSAGHSLNLIEHGIFGAVRGVSLAVGGFNQLYNDWSCLSLIALALNKITFKVGGLRSQLRFALSYMHHVCNSE